MKKVILIISMFMSVVLVYGKSENNDCYWYQKCVYLELDSNEQPIKSKSKSLYPDCGDCMFEIQFDYAPNYKTAERPFTIYLNERNSEKGRVSSKIIGKVNRNIKSSVNYREDGVMIFVEGYQIVVTKKGVVIIYKIERGTKYKNTYIFEPLDFQEPTYSVRYEVLLEKLKAIKWGK
jgi:hypothetical protein